METLPRAGISGSRLSFCLGGFHLLKFLKVSRVNCCGYDPLFKKFLRTASVHPKRVLGLTGLYAELHLPSIQDTIIEFLLLVSGNTLF